ncbi:hypothetical protein [Sphingomonas endophytica]|uniref:Uncharacterized protein n=1 Tax=Sphingomonas endophytica TaxID=869719 RepID=A0A147I9V6_9SPHN|nr:hypothetical protein [Sphingomonas endophytica]KTT76266.1 hypothetical protein NS334_01490 [Sphingomonas endophytica]
MRTGTYRASSYRTRDDARSRLVSIALAIGIAAAIIFALLTMGGVVRGDFGDRSRLVSFDVKQEGATQRQASTKKAERQQVTPERARVTPRVTPERPTPVPPLPEQPLHLPGVMILNSADYAASDIGKIKGTAAPASGKGDAGRGDDTATVGLGPGGEPLYAAEWYRRPRPAEMNPYMPAGKTGWGEVACRTAPRFHVEDCRELGESLGSGLARAVRQAAWQFLVRPPRKGGADQIGAWVRIHIDVAPRGGASDDGD